MKMTRHQARRCTLCHQGLLPGKGFGRGPKAVHKAIQTLHYVQVDTISVVERAHHHVLRSRVPNYEPRHLDQLMKDKKVFEYWSHAAAYLPIEDYRFYTPVMTGFGQKRQLDTKLRRMVLDRIHSEGPLSSKDFEDNSNRKNSGWWDWKPAKHALEHLFLSGELMVAERQGFRKLYDLTERILPADLNRDPPTDLERGQFYIRRVLGALGIADIWDITYSRAAVSRFSNYKIVPQVKAALLQMIDSGEVEQIDIEGTTHYAIKDNLKVPSRIGRKQLHVLSPFDNLVINRARLSRLFNFDYLIECYVPEPKRQFGYFTLPLLLGDHFIGRMDAKLDRKTSHLLINNLWLEEPTQPFDDNLEILADGLCDYARALQCNSVELAATHPPKLKPVLLTLLKSGM